MVGRHREEAVGGAAPSIAEDGVGGAAGGRRGPRLQQPARRDHRLRGSPPAGRGTEPPGLPPRHGDPEGGRPRGGPDPAAPGVQPEAGARAEGPRPQRRGLRDREDAAPPHRRGRPARHRIRRRPRPGQGRPRPDGAGDREPGGQRPRRHAPGRQADHRDR